MKYFLIKIYDVSFIYAGKFAWQAENEALDFGMKLGVWFSCFYDEDGETEEISKNVYDLLKLAGEKLRSFEKKTNIKLEHEERIYILK